jgi:hypothetical protein
MTADDIIATLNAHRPELLALGIAHAGLFGSRARDEAGALSDIDILIDFAPGRIPDVYTFVGLRERIAGLFPVPVDVVDQGGLRPRIRAGVERDLIRAF